MLQMLESLADGAEYDFRARVSPQDTRQEMFSAWVAKYRSQWAIARAIEPRAILGLGWGFGYSAAAFLDAFPHARYLGIEPTSPCGAEGRLSWARRITRDRNAEFRWVDGLLPEWPRGPWDLVHIEWELDPDKLFGILEQAAAEARHILVDDC